MSESDRSVSLLIRQLNAGTSDAVEKLWDRYFPRVIRVARDRLRGARYASADEEDVALSTFNSLCAGAQEGRFPHLSDRDSLWSLLVSIAAHKSVDLIRRENRRKRGGSGSADGEHRLVRDADLLNQLPEDATEPEVAALMGEQFETLVKKLDGCDDPDLLTIAVAKMVGEATSDIAGCLDCTRRTVERKLQLIRGLWEEEMGSEEAP